MSRPPSSKPAKPTSIDRLVTELRDLTRALRVHAQVTNRLVDAMEAERAGDADEWTETGEEPDTYLDGRRVS